MKIIRTCRRMQSQHSPGSLLFIPHKPGWPILTAAEAQRRLASVGANTPTEAAFHPWRMALVLISARKLTTNERRSDETERL